MPHPRIVLIDGFAQIFRSFYAIPALTNSRGEPTNALYGMARFLLKLDEELPGDYGAFVLDCGRPARRMQLLPEYKANRPPMPDLLRAQVNPIREWCAAAGWEILVQEGHEADDLIAAIVKAREGLETAIISFDKDLAQLVTADGVSVWLPAPKGKFEQMGPREVEDKFGVPPAAVRDYLALLGDSSDNIRGVDGVGAKTAAALLQQYGSIAALLEKLDTVGKAGLREKLAQSKALIQRNCDLVSLDLTLPEGWQGVNGIRRRTPDWEKLLAMARDNGFNSLQAVLNTARQAAQNPGLF